jgi:hypothetical protein
MKIKKKKHIMIKVVCSGCGKTRYWDSLADTSTLCCECDGIHTYTKVEVTMEERDGTR